MTVTIYTGDCRDVMRTLPAQSVHACISSPPYFGLRDYGVDGQIGLEAIPDCLGWATGERCGACFVCVLVDVYREVRRVLRDDGTVWLNLGDSYAGSGRGGASTSSSSTLEGGNASQAATPRNRSEVSSHQRSHAPAATGSRGINPSTKRHAGVTGGTWTKAPTGWKQKDLIGIPWRVALALQSDGWYLRQDIIWSKPNPMPESVRDRCTKSHEYLFLLAKSERYYFNAEAIAEPLAESSVSRLSQPNLAKQQGSDRVPGKTNGAMKAVGDAGGTRNKRDVWTVSTKPYSEAHFATFPPALIEPCVLAGCPVGGTVLDHFGGSGTTGEVAERLGRDAILIELNPEYSDLCAHRTQQGGLILSHENAQ